MNGSPHGGEAIPVGCDADDAAKSGAGIASEVVAAIAAAGCRLNHSRVPPPGGRGKQQSLRQCRPRRHAVKRAARTTSAPASDWTRSRRKATGGPSWQESLIRKRGTAPESPGPSGRGMQRHFSRVCASTGWPGRRRASDCAVWPTGRSTGWPMPFKKPPNQAAGWSAWPVFLSEGCTTVLLALPRGLSKSAARRFCSMPTWSIPACPRGSD